LTFRSIMQITFVSLISVFLNCASRGTPGGGPVDRTPPEIIETEPQADSTGIDDLEEIVILFSERMDESSAENAIFISPPLEYEIEWSGGEELTLNLQDTLKHDVTYVVTIGSGASDSRKNRMSTSFQFAFTTGKFIQRGKINGLVYGISEKDPFYVYAYSLPDTPSAAIDPSKYPADFLSQPGANGAFSLSYLKMGNYRVFIVEDQNRNFILDSDYERVGIPVRDVCLDSTQDVFDDLYFRVARIDTIPPQVTGARAVNNGKVLVRLSEPVKGLDPDGISIIDTLKNDLLNIRSVIPNKEEKNQYFIFTDRQNAETGYRLLIKQICDTTNNCQDSVQYADFSGSAATDTTSFRILKTSPRDSAKNVALHRPVSFQMSKAVDSVSFTSAFTIYKDAGDTLKTIWNWDNLENGFPMIENGFQPGITYGFTLQPDRTRSVWGDTLSDSTISRVFMTRSPDEFGSLSGYATVPGDLVDATYLFIKPVSGRKPVEYFNPGPDSTFHITWLPEGKYILGGYIDLNRDAQYSPGKISPFSYAEPFYIQQDTISIRKRWEVSDYRFSFPALESP